MYKKREHIHFMGIGGIGMSGIARVLATQGYTISGCDTGISHELTAELTALGCIIYQEHNQNHLCSNTLSKFKDKIYDSQEKTRTTILHKDSNTEKIAIRAPEETIDKKIDVLVYSSAIQKDDPEIIAAQELGVPVIPRALMLAELMRTKFSVAVTGAHGKTTTTSLISHILTVAGKNPTMIIGGILKNVLTNASLGASDLLVAEADESDRSLLYLNPTMAVITNIDTEHLDTYRDIDDIKATFKNFLERLPFYGKAILWAEDPHIQTLLPMPHIGITMFGTSEKAHIRATEIELLPTQSLFTIVEQRPWSKNLRVLGKIELPLAGIHNVLNALASITLSLEFDISFQLIQKAIKSFIGVKRRFEYKGSYKNAEIFDDYGHHPTEIYHTLICAQRRKKKKLHVIFQPHRYSRTSKLWDDFIALFNCYQDLYTIDYLYLVDIYPASEKPLPMITSERLARELSTRVSYPVLYTGSYEATQELVKKNIEADDLVITIGAGKVYNIGEFLVQQPQSL